MANDCRSHLSWVKLLFCATCEKWLIHFLIHIFQIQGLKNTIARFPSLLAHCANFNAHDTWSITGPCSCQQLISQLWSQPQALEVICGLHPVVWRLGDLPNTAVSSNLCETADSRSSWLEWSEARKPKVITTFRDKTIHTQARWGQKKSQI